MKLAQQFNVLRGRLVAEPRVRAGLWLVALLIALQLLFMLGDARRAAGPEIQRIAENRARLARVLAETDWIARAESARAQLQALENRFFAAETPGLARAEFQSWLEGQVSRHRLELAGLEMRTPVGIEQMPGFQRIGATLQLEPDPPALLRLLGSLADADGRIGIDALSIEPNRRSRTRLDLYAIYRIETAEERRGER